MRYTEIIEDRKGAAKVITINRESSQNKLSINCMNEMTDALLSAEADGTIAAVIITANGEYFCNGGELGDFRIKTPREIREFGKAFIRLHNTICKINKPVIAAVSGHALGGGTNLVEACDLAVAQKSALFGVPEMKNGLAPMMALIGVANAFTRKTAMELALFGNSITADEALSKGLINRVCDEGGALSAAMELADTIAASNPAAVSLTKELYFRLEGEDYEQRLNKGLDCLILLLKSEECEELLNAKDQGRSPDWKSKN